MTKSILLKMQEYLSSDATAFQAQGHQDLSCTVLLETIGRLQGELETIGISKTDSVAFFADNTPGTAVLALGLMTHCIAIPINPDSKPAEIQQLFTQLRPGVVIVPTLNPYSLNIVLENFQVAVIEYKIDQWEVSFSSGSKLDGRNILRTDVELPDDTALILQTSGSTSLPRIVPLTQSNLLVASRNVIKSLSLTQDDSCLHMLPMFHIGGLVDVLLAPLLSGGKVIFNKGFDVDNFFHIFHTFRPTWSQTVPAMLNTILETAIKSGAESSDMQLRFIRSVSAPLPEALYQSASNLLSTSIVEIYGMTECAGVITSNPVDRNLHKAGSVGISAGLQIRISDEFGQTVPCGQEGEIQVKGDSVMPGYLSSMDSEGNADFENGWLRTGDLGYLDEDNFLFITGRLKDIINRGGENISPAEIERVVLSNPLVTDAACFSIPHASLGEDIALAVVANPGEHLSEVEIRDYLRKDLAYFKVPQAIYFVNSIPRHNGKLRRYTLSEQFSELASLQAPNEVVVTAPQTKLTEKLIALWSEILEIDDISPNSDFFFLGGDSLSATILMNKIQETWEIPVLISTIYDSPILHEFERDLINNHPLILEKV